MQADLEKANGESLLLCLQQHYQHGYTEQELLAQTFRLLLDATRQI